MRLSWDVIMRWTEITAGIVWSLLIRRLYMERVNQAKDAVEAIQDSYDDGKSDEFVVPAVITKGGEPVATIQRERLRHLL